MLRIRIFAGLAAVGLLISPLSALAQASFQGLGLPDGVWSSMAMGLSADGSVVAGYTKSASGHEAFRWTSDGGMVGLGDLVGGNDFSVGLDVSADALHNLKAPGRPVLLEPARKQRRRFKR